MLERVSTDIIDRFLRACRRVAESGLVRCNSGNLSMRAADDTLLVTATRSWLSRASVDTISCCRISDGALIEGGKPSAELGFHAGILRTRPDVNVVLHFQTPCATALACREPHDTEYFVIPEIPFYIGPIGRVPYHAPGSAELARAVVGAVRDHDMVQLANHGQVTVARDADRAIQNAEFFELACEIIVRAGDRVAPLPEKDAAALLALRQAAKTRA